MIASAGGAPGFFAGVTTLGTGVQTSVSFERSASDCCAFVTTELNKRQEAMNLYLFIMVFLSRALKLRKCCQKKCGLLKAAPISFVKNNFINERSTFHLAIHNLHCFAF